MIADTEYARQSIAALVAKSYFLAVEAGVQQRLAEDMLSAAEQLIMLAEERQRIGRGDGYEVALSRANAETFRDTVLQLSFSREQAQRAIEALVGRYPSATVDIATELATWPGPIPGGLPSELLERRPDVIAADRRVAAAFSRVQEAKAARLPSISLTTSINSISSDLFVLQDRENPVWSAGAEPARAVVQRPRLEKPSADPLRRAAPGGCGLRPHRRACVRRGRECARGRAHVPADASKC